MPQICANCGTGKSHLRCSRCKQAYYCNKKCQSIHWKGKHKHECESLFLKSMLHKQDVVIGVIDNISNNHQTCNILSQQLECSYSFKMNELVYFQILKHELKHVNITLIDIPINMKYIKSITNGIGLCDVILCSIPHIENENENNDDQQQLKKYLQICHGLGINQIIVDIDKPFYYNKLKQTQFEINTMLKNIGYKTEQIITISLSSINKAALIDFMNQKIKPLKRLDTKPFTLSVAHICHHDINTQVIIGRIIHGMINVGDTITSYPLQYTNTISSIHIYHQNVQTAYHGQIVGLKIRISDNGMGAPFQIGDVLFLDKTNKNNIAENTVSIKYVQQISAIVQLHSCTTGLSCDVYPGSTGLLYINGAMSECKLLSVKWRQGTNDNKKKVYDRCIESGDTAEVIYELRHRIFIDTDKFSRFVILNNDPNQAFFMTGNVLNTLESFADLKDNHGMRYIPNASFQKSHVFVGACDRYWCYLHNTQGEYDKCVAPLYLDITKIDFSKDKLIKWCPVFDCNWLPGFWITSTNKVLMLKCDVFNPSGKHSYKPAFISELTGLNVYDIKHAPGSNKIGFKYTVALCVTNNQISECICKQIEREIHKIIPYDVINVIKCFYEINQVLMQKTPLGRNTGSREWSWKCVNFNNARIIKIECGRTHFHVLDEYGFVWSWGGNFYGQLGVRELKDKIVEDSPIKLKYFSDNNIKILDIKCGSAHSLALDCKGNVYGWGSTLYCQTGHTPFTGRHPTLIKLKQNETAIKIECGENHSYILTNSGNGVQKHYLFGLNSQCQCFAEKYPSLLPHCINEIIATKTNGMKIKSIHLLKNTTTCFVE